MVQQKTSELKEYALNKKLFDAPPKMEYDALKSDIEKNGIKVDLHILPDKRILCGHQRFKIAKELNLITVPCKVIENLKTEEDIERYIINDNLLRRHLTPEQRAILIKRLYEIREKHIGQGKRTDIQPLTQNGSKVDIYKDIAKEAGIKKSQAIRDIQYAKTIEERPELKGQKQAQVLRTIRIEKRKKELKETKLPVGKFNVILADPPWEYSFSISNSRKIENKYPTMELAKIKALSHKLPFNENSVIFLWATAPKLTEAIEVLEAWGFEYKTNAIWDKEVIGMGYYFRNQHELILVGTKGKMQAPIETKYSSIIKSQRTNHSQKPEIVYEIIENLYPHQKYLEIFARNKRKGWEVYGNEVEL